MKISNIRIHRDPVGWRWSAMIDEQNVGGPLDPQHGDGEDSLISALPAGLNLPGQSVEIDRTMPEGHAPPSAGQSNESRGAD